EYFPDPEAQQYLSSMMQLTRIIQWLQDASSFVASNKANYLLGAMAAAMEEMEEEMGPDASQWAYGDVSRKFVEIKHPLSNAVNANMRETLDTEPIARGGNQYTPGATGSAWRQSHGATFKIIVDVDDWERSVGMNSPGQVGDPASPYYKQLYKQWASDEYFPVLFERSSIEAASAEKTTLSPR
ncbi:MAG: penicillin acylase family protein, partial [Bacteroidota bacterium]